MRQVLVIELDDGHAQKDCRYLEKLDAIALQFLCIRLDIFLSSLLYLTRILLSMSIY